MKAKQRAQARLETAIMGFGRKLPKPQTQEEIINDADKIDFSVFGIDPDKVNYKLRGEILRVLKVLNKRGRLFNLRKITNVDNKTVCATAVVRATASLAVLDNDLQACGYSNITQALSNNTKRPVIVYGENEVYRISVDTYMNIVTLMSK